MSAPDALAAALADRYTLDRELGQGGMATVYLATDVRHQRRVAIKVLHQDIAAAMGAERFLKEIQLTAALQHPHILPLFDSGEAAGRVFYVMPFVEGETLRARLDRERQLPVADALRLTSEVASALSYAHARGIVHRDIKPENVLLQDGRVLVADFGIALAASQTGGGARLTQTGISLGTPQYMSPEQAMGERTLDARTDLFALGAMAYEMLAGEPPFSGPNVQAIVSKVLTSQPVPVDELRRNVPEPAAAAIMSALEKLPADRPASAEQFMQILNGGVAVPVGRTSGARKAAAPRSLLQRLLPWGAGALLGVALGAGVMAAMRSTGASTQSTTSAPLRFIFAPTDSFEVQAVCCGRMFAIAPDGQSLVYQARVGITDSAQAQPVVHLFRRDMGSLAPIMLAGADSAVALSISPDGTQLAFVSGTRLLRMPLQGGAVSGVASLPPGFVGGTDWRDNEHIVVSVQHTLYEVSIKDGQLNAVLTANANLQQITGATVVGSTGATVFSYVTRDELPRVHFLAAGSKTPKPLMMGASPHYVPAWRALVVNRQGRLLAFPFDPTRGDTLGPGAPIAEGVALRSPVIAHAEYDVSPSGALVLTRRQEGAIVGWSPTSRVGVRENGASRALPLPTNNVFVYELHFSPDGKRLLMTTRTSERDGTVYAFDFGRQAYQRITGDEETYTAVWAGRSDSIVFVERQQHDLRIRAADGTGTSHIFATLAGWQQVEQIDVRGDYVAFAGRQNTATASLDLAFVKRGANEAVTTIAASPNDEASPALSPDGKWLAYEIWQGSKSDVYLSPFPGTTSRTVVSTSGGRQPVWSADGRTLSFVADNGAFLSVPFTPGTGSAPPTFGSPREIYRRSFARFWTLSPDGTKLLTIDTSALLTLLGLEVVIGYRPTF